MMLLKTETSFYNALKKTSWPGLRFLNVNYDDLESEFSMGVAIATNCLKNEAMLASLLATVFLLAGLVSPLSTPGQSQTGRKQRANWCSV